jgi:hypothetical protein
MHFLTLLVVLALLQYLLDFLDFLELSWKLQTLITAS